MDAARHVARVVFARRVQLPGHRRHVVILPDGVAAADGEPRAAGGDAHGLGKGPEVGIEHAAVIAHQNGLTRLVRGDYETDSELIKEGRQVRCVHAL